jgi:hypothetical protein
VLSHFDDDVVFSSPEAVAGSPVVRGKAALLDYRTAALREHAARMPFVTWRPPAADVLVLRGIAA